MASQTHLKKNILTPAVTVIVGKNKQKSTKKKTPVLPISYTIISVETQAIVPTTASSSSSVLPTGGDSKPSTNLKLPPISLIELK